jgi:hypothetical protein
LPLTSGCGRKSSASAPKSNKVEPRLTLRTDRPTLERLAEVDPDQARRLRPEILCLRPDKRFLIAFGELDRMAAAKGATSLHLSWSGESWRVESSEGGWVAVPPVASYAELRRLLTERTRFLLGRVPATRRSRRTAGGAEALKPPADQLDSASTIEALRKADASSGSTFDLPDADSASAAAHAYVALVVEGLDTLEMADLVRGRLLAFLTLAEAQGRSPDPADEALSAFTLGYTGDAVKIAGQLAAGDPVRLYVERRTDELARLAKDRGASRRTHYLALLSLASQAKTKPWAELQEYLFADEAQSLAILRTAAAVRSFEVDASLGSALLYATIEAMERPNVASAPQAVEAPSRDLTEALFREIADNIRQRIHASPAQLTRRFESDLEHSCPSTRSGLWDSDTCRSWYRGFFYSGLYAVGRRYLDELASVPATREFASFLQGSPPGPGEQFSRWYSDMSSVASGRPVGDAQFDDLVNVTWFGRPVLERTWVSLEGYYPQRDPAPEIGARIAQRLDARPSHLDFMTLLAGRSLLDSVAVERLCVSWLALGASVDESNAIRCRAFLASTAELQALVQRRGLDLESRGDALTLYCYLPSASWKFCDAQFRELGRESGYERLATAPWMMAAEKQGDYASIQAAAEGWLAQHSPEDGLVWYVYQGRRAQALSRLGKPQEAWNVIEPQLRSGQGAVMSWGAEILWELGRKTEAIELASETIRRYPDDAEPRAIQAAMYWRSDRDADAAAVLDPPEPAYKVSPAGWRDEVSKRFADAFAKEPDDRALAAFQVLLARKILGDRLSYLMPRLAEAGRFDLAFRLSSMKPSVRRHPWDQASSVAASYEYLEKSRGRAEASAWIQSAVPKPWREQALESFFSEKHYALLWAAVPPSEEAGLSEWTWLLRAGASLVDDAAAREHRSELDAHYAEPGAPDPSRATGRYLLGMGDRESVMRSLKAPRDRCRAAYFFGLREVAAGRYIDASDWLQVPFDGCNGYDWKATAFARTHLAAWYSSGQNLREAEAHRIW